MTALSAIAAATTADSLSVTTTITTNLFDAPTGACRLAISLAGIKKQSTGASANDSGIAIYAQPQSNPDIAGIGILVSFLVTAYGIFVGMLVAYCCRGLPQALLGDLDKYVFKRPARHWKSPPWWQKAVDASILAYADLQIATGVGILTAAFATMDSLSLYHMQVATYLAWMSSNTHLTAVSLLQTEFRENQHKSTVRRLRLGGMAFLGLMLFVALVPSAAYNWLAILTRSEGDGHTFDTDNKTPLSSAQVPARCFWQRKYSGGWTPDAIWSFLILVVSYVWKGLLLFKSSHKFLKVQCRKRMQGSLQTRLDRLSHTLSSAEPIKRRRWVVFLYKLNLSLYLGTWAIFELAQSFVMSLWICGAGLVWGTFQIFQPRRMLPAEIHSTESTWSYGQVLPIMLLAIPILSFAEGYSTQKSETALKRALRDTSVGEETDNTQHEDEESKLPHTVGGDHLIHDRPVISRLPFERNTFTDTDVSPKEDIPAEDESDTTRHLAPWRSDARIFSSRFVHFSVWGSQIGVLSLVALFIVFYCQLFTTLGIPSHTKFQVTLQTDYGIWFIVGCTIVGWLVMAVLLLCFGATFSSLFEIPNPEDLRDQTS